MKPRSFLDFFKTRSGKLTLFTLGFCIVLVVISKVREHNAQDEMQAPPSGLKTNATDKPQVVQTIQREMELFRPPPPKPEPRLAPIITKDTTPKVATVPSPAPPPPLAPISLFPDSTPTTAEARSLSSVYAPYGRLISCETVVTVDSASVQTPIIGLVTEDIYHGGRLVIPAGTEVHGTAQTDRHRERIASGNSWTLVWQTGEELRLKGVALDREFASDQEGWGITDGSAGLRGRLIKSDNLEEIKLFAATFLSGAAAALTEKETTLFGSIDSRSLNNAPLKGAQQILEVYAKRISDAIQRDGYYVRVPSGKQFYLYVVQTIDRADAVIGGAGKPFEETNPPSPVASLPASYSPSHVTPELSRELPDRTVNPPFNP